QRRAARCPCQGLGALPRQAGENLRRPGSRSRSRAERHPLTEGFFAPHSRDAHFLPCFFPCGWIVSPRLSIATNVSIFFFRPASVFMLWVRNTSAKRFCAVSFANIAFALGSASMAAFRSAGIVMSLLL